MEYRQLGRTDERVSVIGLGTMTWGEQNTEAEAHSQLDLALDHGVNLIDAAEMYPVPPRAETQGLTEKYLGSWLRASGKRDEVFLATKCTGPGRSMSWIRNGETRLSADDLHDAVEGSLRRLGVDTIDLYQLHWPARRANFFGQLGFKPLEGELMTPPEETLDALDALVRYGKIRYVGLSNETPWGVMTFLRIAEERGWPRVVCVQNPYNLLNRSYEVGMAEVSWRESCGLLAYSPLAMGVLTGKYEGGRVKPPGARLTLFERFQRYQTKIGLDTSEAYVALAREHGLDPTQMALAFVNSRPFLTSNLVGATSLEQLETNLRSVEVTLSKEVMRGIEDIHRRHPNPCP